MSEKSDKPKGSVIRALIYLGLFGLALLAAGAYYYGVFAKDGPRKPDDNRPDVVVLVLDAVRYDALFDEQTRQPKNTPVKDAIFRSHVFHNANSTSCWTVASHASLFTGMYPNIHKSDQENFKLSRNLPTLAETFAKAGYHTFGITENGMLSKRVGFDRGFLEYNEAYRNVKYKTRLHYTPEQIKKFLRSYKIRKKPFFMFINLIEAHWQYTPFPERYRQDVTGFNYKAAIAMQRGYTIPNWYLNRASREEKYVSLLRYLYDLQVEEGTWKASRIIKMLKRERSRPKLIFVMSDHGESFNEHGHRDHVFSLDEQLVRIPMFVTGNKVKAGVSNDPVSILDVFPTALRMAGIPVPANQGVDLFGEIDKDRTLYMSYAFPRQVLSIFSKDERNAPELQKYKTWIMGAKKGDLKVVRKNNKRAYLYDISKDPKEENNLIDQMPEKSKEMLNLVDEYRHVYLKGAKTDTDFSLDKDTEENLRSLGYIQ